MKFYGTPNMLVSEKHRTRNSENPFENIKPLFRFDEKGEFETFDGGLIKRLRQKFEHEEGGGENRKRRPEKTLKEEN